MTLDSQMSQVSIRLFGAFRDLSEETELSLKVGAPATQAEVRAALYERLADQASRARRPLSDADLRALVQQSALADERQVLKAGDRIERGARLAILPPVCGG